MKCYADNAEKKSHINAMKTATAVIPRLIMETLFVILFVVVVSYLCFKNESPKEIMGVLGGYLYIGFRLMPGLNRMIAQISLFKSSIPSINRVFEEYHRETPTVSSVDLPNFTFDHNLLLSHIYFSYSSSHQTLNNIFLEIKKGECLGIVGETGSGKSTLVDIVLGLLQPSEGKILVDNQYVVNSKQWHEMLAYVPQVIYLTDDTIEANIAFGENKESINYGRLQKAIEDAQLQPLIKRLPEGVKTLVGERGIRLSGGEKQRIAIARALYRDAQVFIFDEATSALDNETEAKLMEVLQSLQKDRTFIIVAHRLTTLQGCDRIVMLKAGKIEKIVSYQELGLVSENV
jgi:ATP-binding cassette subfamily C protein